MVGDSETEGKISVIKCIPTRALCYGGVVLIGCICEVFLPNKLLRFESQYSIYLEHLLWRLCYQRHYGN